MVKDTTPSYQNQLKYIKELWNQIKDNYVGIPNFPVYHQNLDFKEIEKLMDLDSVELYSVSHYYNQLVNFSTIGNNILQPAFLSLVMTVITAILKERNIFNYLPERERIIQKLYGKSVFYLKENNSPVHFSMDEDNKIFISIILPDLIQQKELNKIQIHLNKPNTIYQKEQEKVADLQNQIDEKLVQQQQKIDDLNIQLEKQHKQLNFVNLSEAFSKIQEEKVKLKDDIENKMKITFRTLLIIPISVFFIVVLGYTPTLYTGLPILTVEILLLYLFRIFYQQFLSVKSELLQLDLRVNLCAFIEGYMEFKEKHKDETVELFEKLVFSNIISDEKKVPATIDGIDSLAKVVCSVQGKSQ